ncbi:MAG TPA: hypothetical protein VI455_09225 [Terriglobia bacterium]
MTPGAAPKILLIGLGDLGTTVLELLAREPGLGPVVAASRNAVRGELRANLARLGAIAQGYAPSIGFTPLDLDQPDAVAEAVRREHPEIILSTATRQTWWLDGLLPPKQASRLRKARFGVWLPVHLTLTLKLMQALRAADYRGITLTAPYPDVVNVALGKLGLAPTCGVGNVDEIAAKVRFAAAESLHQPVERVQAVLVAHHALHAPAFEGAPGPLPPYFLRVYLGNEDVTEAAGGEQLLRTPCRLPLGPASCFLTAGSIVRLIRALATGEQPLLHAPAPEGLPGGYPIVIRGGEIRLARIPGLSREDAIALNEASHPFDGIERVEQDGSVVFCPEDAAALRRVLGYNVQRLKPAEAEDRAQELMAKFGEFARKAGIDLDRAWRAARLSSGGREV